MYHYGIRDKELELFRSYLQDRDQFVEVDTYRSNIVKSLDYSIIHGSKLSAILYILYCNEIPLLYKIMLDTCMFNKITNNKYKDTYDGSRYKDIHHFILNFIDDSTNIISHNDSVLLTQYMNYYYILLEIYYNENKLLINGDKTVLLVSCQNKMRNIANTIKIQTNQ